MMQRSSYRKEELNLSLWWLVWLGLVLVTFSQVLDESLIEVSLGTNLLVFFLMNLYYLPMKMLCVIGRDFVPPFIGAVFEKLILPVLSIILPFFWGSASFGKDGAEGNLLYGISLGENKLIFLIPLFLVMIDPRSFLAKSISISIDLSGAKKNFVLYCILCHWVWFFPMFK
jgi:hypothetical protein